MNLLGLPAITALKLAARVNAISDYRTMILENFPKVFQGLGNLGEPYEISLKPNAVSHALFTARRVPLPRRAQVKVELQRMESLGVISKVDKPTPWCAGMVAVHKKSAWSYTHMRRSEAVE